MMTRDGALWGVLLAVGMGAAFGACGRWALSYFFNSKIALLPLGTLMCNLLGGLLIGALTAWFSTHLNVPPVWRLFLITGLLGGLTTFSTFSAEGVQMMMAGEWMRALVHSCLHLFGSFAATAFAFTVVKHFSA